MRDATEEVIADSTARLPAVLPSTRPLRLTCKAATGSHRRLVRSGHPLCLCLYTALAKRALCSNRAGCIPEP